MKFEVSETFPNQTVVRGEGVEVLLDATGEMPVCAGLELTFGCEEAEFWDLVQRGKSLILRPAKDYGGPWAPRWR